MAATHPIELPINTRDEAEQALGRLGVLRAQVAKHKADLDKKKAEDTAKYSELTAPIVAEASALEEAIKAFGKANRKALLTGCKGKTVNLPTGSIAFRDDPPSVVIKNDDEAAAVAELEAAGHDGFVITKKTVDRQSILKMPDLVEGLKTIKIANGFTVTVKPAEVRDER